ncbi:MAG: hypothetical protein ACRETL_17340 [Gammaproteobacteria bacterium]
MYRFPSDSPPPAPSVNPSITDYGDDPNNNPPDTTSTLNTFVWTDTANQSQIAYTPNTSQPGTVNDTTFVYNGLNNLASATGIVASVPVFAPCAAGRGWPR